MAGLSEGPRKLGKLVNQSAFSSSSARRVDSSLPDFAAGGGLPSCPPRPRDRCTSVHHSALAARFSSSCRQCSQVSRCSSISACHWSRNWPCRSARTRFGSHPECRATMVSLYSCLPSRFSIVSRSRAMTRLRNVDCPGRNSQTCCHTLNLLSLDAGEPKCPPRVLLKMDANPLGGP